MSKSFLLAFATLRFFSAFPSFAAVGDQLSCLDPAGEHNFSAVIYKYGTTPDQAYGLDRPLLTGITLLNKTDESVAKFIEPNSSYRGEISPGNEVFDDDFGNTSNIEGRYEIIARLRIILPQELVHRTPGFHFTGKVAIQNLPYSDANPAKIISLQCVLQ